MGDINRAVGGGAELEYEGKVYTFSPWTFRIQAAYEKYLERKAFESLKALKSQLSQDDYYELLKRHQQEVAIGVYSFGSPYVAKSMDYDGNVKYLTFLMLQPNHPEVTEQFVNQMLDKMREDVLLKVAEANADPTTSTGETTAKS